MSAKILIVDDEPSARLTFKNLLLPEGYHLQFATDGAEGLAQAQAWQPDVILCDVMIPAMDGFELCRQIRADVNLGLVPFILVTARNDRQTKLRGLQVGADDFLSKPVDPFELRVRLHTLTNLDRFHKLYDERRKLEQTHEALDASEECFRTFMEKSVDGYMLTDEQGLIIEWNPALVQITGLAREQALGKAIWDLQAELAVPEKQSLREQTKRILQEMLQSGQHPILGHTGDVEVLNYRGERRFTQQTPFPIPTVCGYRIGAVIRDVTEHKLAEKKMRESNETAQAIFNAVTESVFLMEIGGKVITANEIAAQRLGKSVADLIGANIYDFIPADVGAQRKTQINKVISGGTPTIFEDERFGVWLENSIYPIFDSDGEIRRVAIYGRDITERKLTEEALHKSRALLAEAQRIGHIGHMEWNGIDQTLICSDELYDIFGLPRGSFLSQAVISGMMSANERERIQQMDLRAIQQRGDMSYEYKIQKPDGDERWLHQIGNVTYDENGAPIRMMAIIQDVTERKHADLTLRESEARFRSLFESSNAIMLLIAPDSGKIVNANNAAAQFYGYSREQLETLNIADVNKLPPAQVLEECQRAKREERNYFIFPHCLASGEIRTVEVRSHPILSDNRILLFSIIYDITESVQNQRKLHESQFRMEMALKGANVATWDWNVQTGETVFNDRWAEIVGYRLSELAPVSIQTWRQLCHPDDFERSNELLAKHFAGEMGYYECETRMKHKNGSWVWVIDRGKVMEWDAQGKPVRMFGTHLDITESKKAEQALRSSEEKYRGLMESLNSVVATVDYQGRFLYVNDMGAGRLGGTPQTLIGKNMKDVFPEPLASSQLAGIQRIFREDRVAVFEGQSMAGNALRWYRFSFQPLHDETGQVVQVLINATDIHDLKTAQQELLELNQTLEQRVQERTAQVQDLYDNAPGGYHSLDADGKIIQINQTELDWLGYPHDHVVGHSIKDFLTSSSCELFQEIFPEFKQRGWLRDLALEFIRRDGSILSVLVNGTAIYDEQGNYVSSRSTIFDNTERKKVEAELRSSRQLLQDIVSNVPSLVYILDCDGKFVLVNDELERVLGVSSERLIGQTRQFVLPESTARQHRDNDLQVIQTGQSQSFEESAAEPDGTHYYLTTKFPLYDAQHNVNAVCGISTDITQRKRVEETVRQANLELERAMRVKDEFLASMSHELRTPLNAILGLSQSLLEQLVGPLNERQLASLQIVEASGRHLLALINDILDLSKIEAGQITLDLLDIPVESVCTASLLFIKEAARQKHIKISRSMDWGVEWVKADERRLKQMLVNLLSNAVKFTPEGGQIELQVTGDSKEHTISFSVRDTGIGIAPENIVRLFKPFVQLDSGLNRQFEGTGLGLSLVARMAKLHGGSVSVESELGKGSRFTITLPWDSPTVATADMPNKPAVAAPEIVAANSVAPLILIAEDNEANSVTLSTYLQAKGYRIALARDGNQVLECARRERPALILMDLQMPIVDGLEATRRLRREDDPQIANIPVIALTALAMPTDRQRSLEAGANDYMSKPVELNQLSQIIKHLIRE